MKKKVTLEIGREVEMLGRPMPYVEGDDGPRPMQIRDVILQRIPIAASRNDNQAVRLWNIGMEMDKAGNVFALSELDFELLKTAVLGGEIQVWARVNLDRAFKDAEKEK
jgi:hypothetical protein